MKPTFSHNFLVEASDFTSAEKQVNKFLQRTTLIRYGSVFIDKKRSVSAEHQEFWSCLDQGLSENRKVIAAMLKELDSCGYKKLQDLSKVKQGFESKVLHTLTHMLDGFIGVDSAFFSLKEDSHWLSPSLRKEIEERPGRYWLIHVFAGDIQEALLHK